MCLTFCLKLADKYLANFCNVDSSFGREENEKNLKFVNLSKFKSGVTSDEGAQHLSCPLTNKTNEKVDQLKELALKNSRVTNHECANRVGISFVSVRIF